MGFTVGWEYRSRVTRKWYQLLRRSFCCNKAALSPSMIWGETFFFSSKGEFSITLFSEHLVWKLSFLAEPMDSPVQGGPNYCCHYTECHSPWGNPPWTPTGLASHGPCRETPGEDWRRMCHPGGAAHILHASAATSAPALLMSECYQAKGRDTWDAIPTQTPYA